MLAQPFTIGTKLGEITLAPEPSQVCSTALAVLLVEFAQDAVRRDRRQICAVAAHTGGVVYHRAGIVGCSAFEAAEQKQGARYLQQAQTAIVSALEVGVEGDQGGVTISYFTLHPASCEENRWVLSGSGCSGPTKGVKSNAELDVDPLTQSRIGKIHQASNKGRIDLRRFGEGYRGPRQGILSQHRFKTRDEGDL